MREKNKINIQNILLIVFSVMAFISLLQGIRNGFLYPKDFLYNNFREALFEHSYSDCQFPFTFWMMFPFGLLPVQTARVFWIVCNIGFTGVITWTIRKTLLKELDIKTYIILILAMVSGGAWRTNLSNGQYNLAAIAFFMLAVYFSEKNDKIAGLFLAMCIFKYQVTIPLAVYFLYKRKYKLVGYSLIYTFISFIGCSLWFGGVYNVTMKQLIESRSRGLGEDGDVDIESILGLGDYIIPVFIIGILLLLLLAYVIKWRKDDTLFICASLFVGWAFAYQRIYSFFPLIIPLGYSLEKYILSKRKFYKIEFISLAMLTAAFFWSRTISDNYGLLLERVLFYPAFLLLCYDIGIKENYPSDLSVEGSAK